MAEKTSAAQETPMMQQYRKYREEVPADALLLFRLGDFYEMFHSDAEEGARLLGITLTQRSNYPMAGIPFHAMDNYLPKLLAVGKKVAIVDQVEAPQPGKLVKRALTRIITPGTTLEEHHVEAKSNHYLLALCSDKNGFHLSWLDLTTGDFQIASDRDPQRLMPLVHAITPREILLPEVCSINWAHDASIQNWYTDFDYFCSERPVTELGDYAFDAKLGAQRVLEALGVLNLDGFGIDAAHPALGAAGALIHYATGTLCAAPKNLRSIKEYKSEQSLLIDPATLRNLEIFRASHGGGRSGTLLEAIDHTRTAPGARLLEKWLCAPLLDLPELTRRQSCVQEFADRPSAMGEAVASLQHVRDLERVLGRLQNRLRSPRELGAVLQTLNALPQVKAAVRGCEGEHLNSLALKIGEFESLRALLSRALNAELPTNIQNGGVIAEGFDAELDRLRSLGSDNKAWLAQLEQDEREATGIKSLKVKYNGAFGYFIEISKAAAAGAPEHYIRRQTMTNAERFVTEELRQKEKEILHAEERSLGRETEVFEQLIDAVLAESDELRRTAAALAEIDLFAGWAGLARDYNYCRPHLDESDVLEIEQGRHPVVEQMLGKGAIGGGGASRFVPNDTLLCATGEQIALITGPNMAGKSTYIRQVALIVLLAQVGCFVPASRCRVGLVDRIFSRVGASDELARGKSTFMVEMSETANILNNATSRSLVILDEIGRGTSTYDGLSIAWSVIEHLHGKSAGQACADETASQDKTADSGQSAVAAVPAVGNISADSGPRTLFATHYHELTQLEKSLPRLRNYCVAVKEWADEIRFLHSVQPGAADRSYGIAVARLAGLPQSVIERAKVVLAELENESQILPQALAEPQSEAGFRQRATRGRAVRAAAGAHPIAEGVTGMAAGTGLSPSCAENSGDNVAYEANGRRSASGAAGRRRGASAQSDSAGSASGNADEGTEAVPDAAVGRTSGAPRHGFGGNAPRRSPDDDSRNQLSLF